MSRPGPPRRGRAISTSGRSCYGLDRRRRSRHAPVRSCRRCARGCSRAGEIDLGMVPSITYLDRPGDRIVPGVCIGSDGPVASVALFSRVPLRDVRTHRARHVVAHVGDRSRGCCARGGSGSRPTFVPHAPDLAAMLAVADAALLIGDPALFVDHRALGAEKIDLGAAWTDDDRPAVRVGVLGRAGRAPSAPTSSGCCRRRPTRACGTPTRSPTPTARRGPRISSWPAGTCATICASPRRSRRRRRASLLSGGRGARTRPGRPLRVVLCGAGVATMIRGRTLRGSR